MAADRRNRMDDEHDVNFGYGSISCILTELIAKVLQGIPGNLP